MNISPMKILRTTTLVLECAVGALTFKKLRDERKNGTKLDKRTCSNIARGIVKEFSEGVQNVGNVETKDCEDCKENKVQ